MTLNASTGATPSQQAVDDQIQRGIDGETLLTPTQVAVLLADAYDAYAKEGVLSGADLTAGGTKSLLETGFITDNTPATITTIATGICNYWATNNTPGTPAHGGTAVQSVTIPAAAAIPAMEDAIVALIADEDPGGWVGFYNATQPVIESLECIIVELMPPNATPTPFIETIT